MIICFSGCPTGVLSVLQLHWRAEIGTHLCLIALAQYWNINQGDIGISTKELVSDTYLLYGLVLSDDPSKLSSI